MVLRDTAQTEPFRDNLQMHSRSLPIWAPIGRSKGGLESSLASNPMTGHETLGLAVGLSLEATGGALSESLTEGLTSTATELQGEFRSISDADHTRYVPRTLDLVGLPVLSPTRQPDPRDWRSSAFSAATF
ncbi:hypothetical protein V3481_003731 [Fusarium oxysporum f. sp. vasinfectum]|jgi:hypothetical protein